MALSPILTPVAVLIELIIGILGLYVGYAKKKTFGYLFAITFLLFGLFDFLGQIGLDADILSIINIIAVLAGLCGMYQLLQES